MRKRSGLDVIAGLCHSLRSRGWQEVLAGARWESIHDGFGLRPSRARNRPQLTHAGVGAQVTVIRRPLASSEHNLPDAAVFQALRGGTPVLALGLVTNDTNRRSEPSERTRWQWQALLWDVYEVAFVDVGESAAPFDPAEALDDVTSLAPALPTGLVDDLRFTLACARADGKVPAPPGPRRSARTETLLRPFISKALEGYGYSAQPGVSYVLAPWWGHLPDMVFCSPDGQSVAVEVKADEDWDHPLGEPLADLMGHHAVVNIRVPPEHVDRVEDVRETVTTAERALEETGRAAVIYVWPSGHP